MTKHFFIAFGIGWTLANPMLLACGVEVGPIRWGIGFVAIGIGLVLFCLQAVKAARRTK